MFRFIYYCSNVQSRTSLHYARLAARLVRTIKLYELYSFLLYTYIMKRTPITIILPNIRSAMNVGAILRTADGINAEKVYLTGYTATPEHPKVAKTSLGAENSVPWEHVADTKELLRKKKAEGYLIIGLELTKSAVKIWDQKFTFPVALLVGNEIGGIPEDEQVLCDQIIYLPMLGIKESLNVATSTGITAYEMLRQYDIANNLR